MKKTIVVWGASGHAKVVADIIRQEGKYDIASFLDDIDKNRQGSQFCGATVLGGSEQLDGLLKNGVGHLIFGFGDNNARLNLSELIREKGFQLVTAIHPRAIIVQSASIGAGTVVCAAAVVGPDSVLGENIIINTSASVDHECVIEGGAHIGPGVHLGGRVHIGRGCWIGIGATVSDRIHIGEGSIIGAGAVVLDNIPSNVVAYGVPAKVIREAKNGQ